MKMFKYGLSVLLFLIFTDMVFAHKIKTQKKSKFYSSIISKKAAFQSYNLNLSSILQRSVSPNFSKSLHYAEFHSFENPININNRNEIPHFVEIDIPFKGKTYHCVLERNHIQSPTYHLNTSQPVKAESIPAVYYRGVIEGQYHSWATMAVIDGEYRLMVAHHDGNIEVNHVEKGIYSIYESKDQKVFPDVIDDHHDDHDHHDAHVHRKEKTGSRLGSDCLEIYIECDFQSYVDNGNSVANTEAWAMSIMNDVSTIYTIIDIPLVVSEIFVWNTNDPYESENSLTSVRNSFVQQIQNGYTGRVAQLFSTRPLSGGLAYGIGGVCGQYPDFPGPYHISTELSTNFDPYPNFSYTVNVVAHELGHVLGARHTHACVWGPEFDTQIDDCGNVYAINNGGTPEGTECFDEMNPIIPVGGGTIMSFCNLSGDGINLSDGFGTEVGDYIFEQYSTAICATGEQCATIPPSNDNCTNAKLLSITGQCSYFTYDNILSTASGVSNPSCGSPGSGQDVWFTMVPQNPDLSLDFNPVSGQVENVIITVYSGDCGNLTEIHCEAIFNVETQIKLNGLIPNDTLYVRIIEDGSDVEGSFELCVVDSNLPCHPAINALVDLYNNTNGASWTNNSGWIDGVAGSNCTPCNWYGIKCDNLENIIEIDLFNNNLNGTVPTSLEDLTRLRTIKLFLNNLTGNFPDIWANMADMEFIDLSNNQFTGSMPSSLGNLQKLNTLYIENNNMTGGLLPEIGNLPLLNVYWARDNNFSGCFPGTYSNLCDIGSITFINNPLLPNTGILDQFCTDGTGGDIDEDGFCFGTGMLDDCVDTDNTIYPNAPELCDGKDNDCDGQYDEGVTAMNTWLPSGGGDWQIASNWSLGTLPKPCEDIFIPASGSTRNISVPAGTFGYGRSLSVGSNSVLTIDGDLEISGSDGDGVSLDLNGTIVNNGMIDVFNIQNTGINVSGLIENYGTINVSNLSTAFELLVSLSGQIDNKNGSQITLEKP